jgi:hypothetical protein
MLDLYNQQYDRQTLKAHIYEVRLLDILKTQKIDAKFATRYILNAKYQLHSTDQHIVSDTVLLLQPHITYEELQKCLCDYESDDDSMDDFETVSNK